VVLMGRCPVLSSCRGRGAAGLTCYRRPVRTLVAGAVTALLLVGVVGVVMPARVEAACGGGGGDGYLARYAGKLGDTILLGRLIDADHGIYRFDVLTVYRGEAASPMQETGVRDVGGCTGQTVMPGQRFIYVSGDDETGGPMKLLFPHVSGRGWLIEHYGSTSSLDRLLRLLGVPPDTSELPVTSTSGPTGMSGDWRQFGLGSVAALCAAYLLNRRLRARSAL
jgi:hypothetical protein